MKTSRRDFAQKSTLGLLGAGFLARVDKVAAAQTSTSSMFDALRQQASGKSEALLAQAHARRRRAARSCHRRPPDSGVEQADGAALQEQAGSAGREGIPGARPAEHHLPHRLLAHHDRAARSHVHESRRCRPLVPLSRRSTATCVTSWWFGGGRIYFDFKHGEGASPTKAKWQQGKTVDLFRFLLEGIKEHGIQGTDRDRRRVVSL